MNSYVTYVPAPIPETWDVRYSNLGSVLTGQYIDRISNDSGNAVSTFTLISGTPPPGINFYANGKIIGTATITSTSSVIPQHSNNFTVQISYVNGVVINRNFIMNVVDRSMLTKHVVTDYVTNDQDSYTYKFGLNTEVYNATWHLAYGELPPRMSLDPLGKLVYKFESVILNDGFRMDRTYVKYKSIIPFIREQFTATAPALESLLPNAWNSWLSNFLSTSHEFDYQFLLELRDSTGTVLTAHTFRIVHLIPPKDSEFFYVNRGYLTYDEEQRFYIVLTTVADDISWQTESNLGTVVNGSVSNLFFEAKSNKKIEYIASPFGYNRFPQGVQLLTTGEISGRFSYRCYQDDPATVPLNNIYEFTVRARSKDFTTYADRKFTLNVERFFNRPLEQLYIRAFPPVADRVKLLDILNNKEIFEPRSLYRPTDPWYGVNFDLKFLFATGLEITEHGDYERFIMDNHATKRVYFGQLSSAIAHNSKFETVYEVVYLPIIDERSQANRLEVPPMIIDLRSHIKNYYVKNNQSFYILKPTGLEQMKHIITTSVGINNFGLLPLWMTSLQPSTEPGKFTSPLGFVFAVPLVYVRPGYSKRILYRLRDFNFNSIPFEFDRYILDTSAAINYNKDTGTYKIGGNLTVFDQGGTIFDNNSTKILENLEYYADPGQSDKYIKFPKAGVFI